MSAISQGLRLAKPPVTQREQMVRILKGWQHGAEYRRWHPAGMRRRAQNLFPVARFRGHRLMALIHAGSPVNFEIRRIFFAMVAANSAAVARTQPMESSIGAVTYQGESAKPSWTSCQR